MLKIKDEKDEEIKKIKNSNSYINFVDDRLEAIEEISIFDMSKLLGDNFMFPNISWNNFYQTTRNSKELDSYLVNSYIENDNKPIYFSKQKKDLVNHFKPYMIRNHDNLSDFEEITAYSHEYNLLTYVLFDVLCDIFPTYKRSENTFKVYSVLQSPLLYKISVELPNYIYDEIQKYDYLFENALKTKTVVNDSEVRVTILKQKNNMVIFNIVKFTDKKPISLADVFNFGMGYAFSDIKKTENYPLVLGLGDNESPLVRDYNTKNISIIGVQNHSPIAYNMALNLVMFNHYEDLNVVVCSKQDKPFWEMYSRNPHVLSYSHDLTEFRDIVLDIHEEHKKRMKVASKKKVRTFKDLRQHLTYNSRLVFVIDGLSDILKKHRNILPNASEIVYQQLFEILNEIALYSDKTGISILATSERGDKGSFPQNIMHNSEIKLAMDNVSENDKNTMFGVDMSNHVTSPIGLDYMICSINNETPFYLKTCAIGGLSPKQTLSIVRVIAFDWVRKAIYNEVSIVDRPKGLDFIYAYTRDKQAKDSISKITDGKVIPNW